MPNVILYEHENYGGWAHPVDGDVELSAPHRGEASSLKVLVNGWVTFHSKDNHTGSHLCVKGPRVIPMLSAIGKKNGLIFNDGDWNNEIVSVDARPFQDKPYDGDHMSTHIE